MSAAREREVLLLLTAAALRVELPLATSGSVPQAQIDDLARAITAAGGQLGATERREAYRLRSIDLRGRLAALEEE